MYNKSILVPKRDIVIPHRVHNGLRGRYRMEVRRSDGTLKGKPLEFANIITDIGLNRLGSGSQFGGVAIGTGTATPSTSDTGLQTLSAFTSAGLGVGVNSNSGPPNYITSYEVGYRFNAGTLNGNYTEIGMGWSSTTLFSRALILDGGGSPTTLTVLPTEFLDVYYAVELVPDLTTHTSSVTIAGVTYSVDRKPAYVGNTSYWSPAMSSAVMSWAVNRGTHFISVWTGSLGAVTAGPSGTYLAAIASYTTGTYVSNSLERTGSITWGLSDGNLVGGIKSLMVSGGMQTYQYEFDTAIPKDNTRILTINGKVTWNRV